MMNQNTDQRKLTPVKIFGERNTSTNAVSQLIRANFSVVLLPSVVQELPRRDRIEHVILTRLGLTRLNVTAFTERIIDRVFVRQSAAFTWKHSATVGWSEKHFKGILLVFCVRNPASWLLSLHRNPYHARQSIPANFEDFLLMPWQTLVRDRLGKNVVTPIELYNLKMESYLLLMEALKNENHEFMIVRFEDFATNQEQIICQLSKHLRKLDTTAQIVSNSTKDSNLSYDYYADYYGNEKWKTEISKQEWAIIRGGIDWDVAGKFGYPVPKIEETSRRL